MKQITMGVVTFLLLAVAALTATSCLDEQAPGERYVFTGYTVAQFLEKDEWVTTQEPNGSFSDFIAVLKEAGHWSLLQTYGEYTCFAPSNDAFRAFYAEKSSATGTEYNLATLLEDKLLCDTIARTHIIEYNVYTTDLTEGALPRANLLDRYLSFTCPDSIDGEPNVNSYFYINNQARTLEIDDSVQNGVVHILDAIIIPRNMLLGDIIGLDPNAKIFNQALTLTQYANYNLTKVIDERYKTPLGDSCTTGDIYDSGNEHGERGIYPERRYFRYTGFVETDATFAEAGINSIDDLIAKAKEVYDESYPKDAGLYDDDFTHPRNPLNRFMAYHFLPEQMAYNQFNATEEAVINNFSQLDEQDREDFFESMLSHAFVRISSPGKGLVPYINRRSVPGKPMFEPGSKIIIPPAGIVNSGTNGYYYYIDQPLWYSKHTREVTLNVRMRYDGSTLSPDFINSGGRGGGDANKLITTAMKRGFVQNIDFSDQTAFYVRYRNPRFAALNGDENIVKGMYDLTFKLPPIPYEGTYELRLGACFLGSRGVVQIYFGEGSTDPETGYIVKDQLKPCGIPLDLRQNGNSSGVGWFNDGDFNDDLDLIRAADKSMRNRGYMKGQDSYAWSGGPIFRNFADVLRRIIINEKLDPEKDYYLRMRQVLDNPKAELSFDFIEIVPKDVYGNEETPEDWH